MEILLFAILSVYLFYRLWSVLGTRTGNERERNYTFAEPQENDNIVVMPFKKKAEESIGESPVDHFEKIRLVVKDFSEEKFLQGAKKAYEIVTNAFASGDKERLEKLLAVNVYKRFCTVIDDRLFLRHRMETEILDFLDMQVVSTVVDMNNVAQIVVAIKTEQLTVTFDENDTIIDNPHKLADVISTQWTFEKTLDDASPVWVLAKIRSDK
jgi:predicted lipid-binding transport protein (Tim44 family)